MKANESAQVDMFRTVITTSDAHPTAYTGFTVFTAPLARFKTVVEKIDEAVVMQQTSSKPATTTKAGLRTEIIPDIVRYAAALRVISVAAGDGTTEEMNELTPSDLRNAGEDKFYGIAQRVMQDIGAVAAATLTPLKISAAQIAATGTKLAEWQGMRKEGRHRDEENSVATATIASLIKEGKQILTREMDPAVELLRFEQPTFYAEYQGSREVIDASFNTQALKVSVTTLENGASVPVGNAQGIINPGGIEKMTGDGGTFFVPTLETGTYTLSLAKHGL